MLDPRELPEALQHEPNHPRWALDEGAQFARRQRNRAVARLGIALTAFAAIWLLASVIAGGE